MYTEILKGPHKILRDKTNNDVYIRIKGLQEWNYYPHGIRTTPFKKKFFNQFKNHFIKYETEDYLSITPNLMYELQMCNCSLCALLGKKVNDLKSEILKNISVFNNTKEINEL
jgi:hypothetical protein